MQVMYSDGEQPVSLGKTLVKAGYAKLVNWGLEMMSVNGFTLREAERNAKQQRVGIWRNYVAPATAGQPFVFVFVIHTCVVAICSPNHCICLCHSEIAYLLGQPFVFVFITSEIAYLLRQPCLFVFVTQRLHICWASLLHSSLSLTDCISAGTALCMLPL